MELSERGLGGLSRRSQGSGGHGCTIPEEREDDRGR